MTLMVKKVERLARKTKYGEPLVSYSIMLRREQLEYLKEKENASDWVREAIDMRIEADSGEVKAVDVVAVSKRITFLEQRIEALKKTPEYVRAKDIIRRFNLEHFKKIREQLTKDETTMFYDVYPHGGGIAIRLGYDHLFQKADEMEVPAPGWRMETLQEFMSEHEIDKEIPLKYALRIIKKMEEAFPYEVRLVEGYEKRMAELQNQIEKLKEKITE